MKDPTGSLRVQKRNVPPPPREEKTWDVKSNHISTQREKRTFKRKAPSYRRGITLCEKRSAVQRPGEKGSSDQWGLLGGKKKKDFTPAGKPTVRRSPTIRKRKKVLALRERRTLCPEKKGGKNRGTKLSLALRSKTIRNGCPPTGNLSRKEGAAYVRWVSSEKKAPGDPRGWAQKKKTEKKTAPLAGAKKKKKGRNFGQKKKKKKKKERGHQEPSQ